MADEPFIVAEISKNWRNGSEVVPGSGLVAQTFERIINVNFQRGYVLHSFQVDRRMVRPDELNETVIAVFRKVDPADD
jgi:hypothetical protein